MKVGQCRVGVVYGPESELYSFPGNHPMNSSRTKLFFDELKKVNNIDMSSPVMANEDDLLLFHRKEYVDFVKEKSESGTGYLDNGDTPAFSGVYEASLYAVGSTLYGLEMVSRGKLDHFFNPVGGLHHARKDRAGGFCVFNDAAIAIAKSLREGKSRVAYVDIDAHHGDGVYYGFEGDPRVIIADIHEDGRYLYPGTGFTNETGIGQARDTKLNIPLAPGSGDDEFFEGFDKALSFIDASKPEIIFLQCGADGLRGDPLTHLNYSAEAHAHATRKLHELSHKICSGRILAMGGGGYHPENVRDAWLSVVRDL
ncbi:MAG TPA: acetoin utilization protein AcuC [Nitrososphaerales archaeon]|nr:acetoin utilization protein AcuC [Nitrososphaerales archaeon]